LLLPQEKQLRRAATGFRNIARKAAEACYNAHTKSADALAQAGEAEGLEQAQLILEERDELFIGNPYWLPPIPPHVRVNIDALREHCPQFIDAEGLSQELKAIAKVAKRTDKLRFREAVDHAIDATKATEKESESTGYPNCRDDILLVLGALRSGEYDMSQFKIHYRNHRVKRWYTGLPGVTYGKENKEDPATQILEAWKLGAKVTGIRGAKVHVSLEGTVIRADAERFEVLVIERWRKNGKNYNPEIIWSFQRVREEDGPAGDGFGSPLCASRKALRSLSSAQVEV